MCSSMPKPGDNSTEMVCSDDDISRRLRLVNRIQGVLSQGFHLTT